MSEEHLIIEKRNTVANVTLNRPEVRNAFNGALIEDLTQTFLELDRDDEVRAVVLTGAGKAFCAGADLNWMKSAAEYSYEQNLAGAQTFARMLATLDGCRSPPSLGCTGPPTPAAPSRRTSWRTSCAPAAPGIPHAAGGSTPACAALVRATAVVAHRTDCAGQHRLQYFAGAALAGHTQPPGAARQSE